MRDAAELGTVLGVWAHPDDDIYLSAGLMAAAVEAGQRVVDVTATHGEGGSMDEERWPPASMGEVRTKELLRSLDVLGVKEHHFLEGPVDIDMESGLDPVGAEQVRTIMEEVDPDSVFTFGPEGNLALVPTALIDLGFQPSVGLYFRWNDFLFALSLTSTSAARTVPAAMSYFTGATTFEKPTGPIAAASVVITIPIVIFVLLFQRRIVAGLTSGAVKG